MSASTLVERIALLFDTASFRPDSSRSSALHLCGAGTIDGQRVYLIHSGPTEIAARRGERSISWSRRLCRFLEDILAHPAPVVFLFDAGPLKGKFHDRGHFDALDLLTDTSGSGRVFFLTAQLLGKVPVCSYVTADLHYAAAIRASLCHYLLLKPGVVLRLADAATVKAATGQLATERELGSSELHHRDTGGCDGVPASDREALALIRRYVSFFPSSRRRRAAARSRGSRPPLVDLGAILPADPRKGFDMRAIAEGLVDEGSFLETRSGYAGELLTGLGRIGGTPFGIVGNNSRRKGGALYPSSCDKLIDFVTHCDRFRLPLVFLADTPGFAIGIEAERGGILRHIADLYATLARLTTPRVSVVVRKAFSGGLFAMAGASFSTATYALSGAQVGVMGERVLGDMHGITPAAFDRSGFIADTRDLMAVEYLASRGRIDGVVDLRALRRKLTALGRRHTGATSTKSTRAEKRRRSRPLFELPNER